MVARLRNHQSVYINSVTGEMREENVFRLKASSNCKVVSVKKDRQCAHCNNVIHAKSKCYTINKKYEGRKWICFNCVPEPNVVQEKYVGCDFHYFSNETDEWGRHKNYHELDDISRSEFDDAMINRIFEDEF